HLHHRRLVAAARGARGALGARVLVRNPSVEARRAGGVTPCISTFPNGSQRRASAPKTRSPTRRPRRSARRGGRKAFTTFATTDRRHRHRCASATRTPRPRCLKRACACPPA